MADNERRLELYETYRETGYQGRDEHTRYHRLIVRGNSETGIATLEIEKESGSAGKPATTDWTKRYEIGLKDLVELIEKHGKLVS